MSEPAQRDVLDIVLCLPKGERAELAAALLASLDDEPYEPHAVVDAAWAAEIRRRLERLDREGSQGEPWEVVRDRLRARLG